MIPASVKLILLLCLPCFSYIYLKQNFEKLDTKEFKLKYDSLYQNMYPLKPTVYQMTTLFCIKRLIFGISTAYLSQFVVAHMYVYVFIPLFCFGFNLTNRPMTTRLDNFKENINEVVVLICAYFIPMFTQWICDPMVRYQLGWIYNYIMFSVVLINFLIIFYQIFIEIRKQNRKRIWISQWTEYFQNVSDQRKKEVK